MGPFLTRIGVIETSQFWQCKESVELVEDLYPNAADGEESKEINYKTH